MTTWGAAKPSSFRIDLEDLKNIRYAFDERVRRAKESYRNSRLEKWNAEHLAMLQSRGGAPYK